MSSTMHDFFKPRRQVPAAPETPKHEDGSTKEAAVNGQKRDLGQCADDQAAKRAHVDIKHESLPFAELCDVFDKVAETTKRLEIAAILRAFFARLMDDHPADVVTVVHLCLSRLGPAFRAPELGLGEALLLRTIATTGGVSVQRLRARLDELGDIGLLAEQTRARQTTLGGARRALDVARLFRALEEISTLSGASATTRKAERVAALYGACKGNEARYLFRLLEGKLRIGLAEQSLLAGLAQASVLRVGPPPPGYAKDAADAPPPATDEADEESRVFARAVQVLKHAYNCAPDYAAVVPPLMAHGVWQLPEHVHLTPGVPLKPMLAFPTRSIAEVLERFDGLPFTCEHKYDGERGQIHGMPDGSVRIFSRNSEDLTQKYPEVPERIRAAVAQAAATFVLDCEMVAYDSEAGRILPFQILSTRKRKDVSADGVEVHVCVFAFDLLYLDGRPLVTESLRTRRELLHAHFAPVPGRFAFAEHTDSANVEDIQTALDDAVAAGCEGLMVKTLDAESSYEPSRRSRKWLKVKKDYLDGVADALDLVVIGGYAGRGKRTGVFGGFLLACYDPDAEAYEAICKIGTGFSEADLEAHRLALAPHTISAPRPYYRVTDAIKPDVWFAPAQVWEVKAADLSLSPTYTAAAGRVPSGAGVSLRFPRFLRVREDKTPEDATTSRSVAALYSKQALVSERSSALDDEEY